MSRLTFLRAFLAAGVLLVVTGIMTTNAMAASCKTNIASMHLKKRHTTINSVTSVKGRVCTRKQGNTVALEFRGAGAHDWHTLKSTHTKRGGRYLLRTKLPKNGRVRVRVMQTNASAAQTGSTSPSRGVFVHQKIILKKKRLRQTSRSGAVVVGRVAPGKRNLIVRLQARTKSGWQTVAKQKTRSRGQFQLKLKSSRGAKIRVITNATRDHSRGRRLVGRTGHFRLSHASWYGPGLYGNHLGCGGRLSPGTLGVAHKHLPCGSKVTLNHGGRYVTVSVIDRGPFIPGREFDLTAATAKRIGFSGHGLIRVAT